MHPQTGKYSQFKKPMNAHPTTKPSCSGPTGTRCRMYVMHGASDRAARHRQCSRGSRSLDQPPMGSYAANSGIQCPSLAGLKLVLEARAGWTAQVDWARVSFIADPDTHREVQTPSDATLDLRVVTGILKSRAGCAGRVRMIGRCCRGLDGPEKTANLGDGTRR
ncbi:MAG: hypothetical protein A2133_05130 [Actinobacteria bacterium RBG_16_64_13]|nr:MAG: hypothetical protein A2133_05130 [Actinobacteria bacterium RBG_16_64_13]